MATLPQMQTALVRAHQAGDLDSARKLATVINREKQRQAGQHTSQAQIDAIPGMEPSQVPETVPDEPGVTIGEGITAAGENVAMAASGATVGTAKMMAGALRQAVEEIVAGNWTTDVEKQREVADRIEAAALAGMESGTYIPESEAGQQLADVLGQVGQQLAPLAPMFAEAGVIGQGAKVAAGQAARVGTQAAQKAGTVAKATGQKIAERASQTPDGSKSLSAAETDAARVRQGMADELGIKISEGQATRDQKFEREMAKDPELGEPIRELYADQNVKIQQKLDQFIDDTGARLRDGEGIEEARGSFINDALWKKADRDKAEINKLYDKARAAGEMQEQVTIKGLAKHFIENRDDEDLPGVSLKAVKDAAIRRGLVIETDSGLVDAPADLNRVMKFREFLTSSAGNDKRDIRHATIMKRIVDDETQDSGGELFQKARQAYKAYVDDFENVTLVNDLMNTKRGTNDRKIAMENSVNKISNASLETIRHLRKVLGEEGEDGQQAWREIQGGVVRKIRDTALKRSTTNERSDRIVSAAQLDRVITDLANSGKLEMILGKQQSDKVLLLRDVALDILTAPPGQINHSNTATILAMMFDLAMTGATGVPTPIASISKWVAGEVKEKRLKARIEKALRGFEDNDG